MDEDAAFPIIHLINLTKVGRTVREKFREGSQRKVALASTLQTLQSPCHWKGAIALRALSTERQKKEPLSIKRLRNHRPLSEKRQKKEPGAVFGSPMTII